MKKLWICSLLLLSLAGCTVSTNQAPQINSNLSPASAVAGSAGFSLTVTGSAFTATCVVLWNGSQRPTRIVSSTQAVATIAQPDVAVAGTAIVSVMDTSTGLKSNTVTFVVTSAGPPPPTVSVTLTPNSTSLTTGGSMQFTVTVSGTSNTAVTWSATGGTITSSGMYTAPGNPGTYTVKATSVADSTKSASATVTVTAPATVSVSISPTAASLATGATQQFTATVSGTSNTAVTWKANGGAVSSGGLYTAPATAGTYSVTATSVADPTKSASASVSVAVAVQHRATVSWTASSSAVTGYNVYRATQSGGPYTMLNSGLISGTTFVDSTVVSGATYYYVATAVDSSGVESAFSNQITAVIPIP